MWFLNTLYRFFMWCLGYKLKRGEMTLVISGVRAITVHTGFTPKKVQIELDAPCGTAVCQADMDCFDWRIVPGGFVFICKLTSESRKVKWTAIGRKKHKTHSLNVCDNSTKKCLNNCKLDGTRHCVPCCKK